VTEPRDVLPAERSFRRLVAALVGYGVLSQALLISGAFRANPDARAPVVDARHYWEWAGRIAEGELVQATPFYSAPLYPYVIGAVRALGGGLPAAAALNGVFLIAAACLLAVAGRRGFGAAVGAFAGFSLLVLRDVALETSQVLAGPLQILLVALVLERASAFRPDRARAGAASLGASAGLLALSWPALLPALLPLAFFVFARVGARRAGSVAAVLFAAVAALVIAPATAHNRAASGEWIPISAHGGITFWHGNNPEASGTFASVGVENDKNTYHLDALSQARAALGPETGWRDTSDYFFEKGLAWWREDPLHASGVALRKLWYTLSGRVYGDVHPYALEVRDGLVPFSAFAPVPVAWITPLGLVAALLSFKRRPIATLPLIVVVGLPILVCVAFWYSPRYRLPAVPGLALASAAALGWSVQRGTAPARTALILAALAVGVLSGPLNRALGFDPSLPLERRHLERTAASLGSLGEHTRAATFLERAVALDPADADLRQRTFLLLRAVGREADAVALLSGAPEPLASEVEFRVDLAWVLATSPADDARDGARALSLVDGVLALPGAAQDPAVLDVRAAALAELRRFPAALEAIEAALQWTRAGDPLRTEMALRRDHYRQGKPWREHVAPIGVGA
jgi:tetratricopeptide (TPR) repeat protein